MKSSNVTIGIKEQTCIQCGKCVQVCPNGIMIQEKKGAKISVDYLDTCIACGHCVDVCPTDSVLHSVFPPAKVHVIDYSQLPSPEQVMLLIKSRRSNRVITSKPIPASMLDLIVEAAGYAPTASNKQQVSFTVITDPEKLKQVADLTVQCFDSVMRKLNNPIIKCLLKPFMKSTYAMIPAFIRLKQQHEMGNDPILRKATALLIIHTPKNSHYGSEDANLAYQNASLMAQSLGVSQIYMGFVLSAVRQGKGKALSEIFGVDGKVQAIMALGIPAFKYQNYTERPNV